MFLSVFALVVVVTVMNGFNRSMRNRLLAVEPHLTVQFPSQTPIPEILGSSILTYIKDLPQVQADVFETQDVIVRTQDGLFSDAVMKGLKKEALNFVLEEAHRVAKEVEPPGDQALGDLRWVRTPLEGKNEVLMGVDLANQLNIFEGDTVTVIAPETLLLPIDEIPDYEKATVLGIVSTRVQQLDARMIFYVQGKSFHSFSETASRQTGIELRLPNPEQFHSLKSRLAERGYPAESWVDRNSALFTALRLEKTTIGAFLALAALIAASSMITVLFLLLAQKSHDIGILLTMGLSPKATQFLFASLGSLLAGIGILGGLVLGILTCLGLEHFPLFLLPDIYYESRIPIEFDGLFVGGVLVFATLTTLGSVWLPTRGLLKLTPSEIIRKR